MKAYRLHDIGDIRFEEIDKPTPQPGEVLVKVRAAGICGSDIPRIYRTGAYHHPMTPGHEFSGEVVELGEGALAEWAGKRVGIFPLIPCRQCSSCRKKKYEMCKHYNYLGSRTDGGFAEYVRVPEWNLIELPDSVSFQQAAMLEPMAVAVHALRRSGLLGNLAERQGSSVGNQSEPTGCQSMLGPQDAGRISGSEAGGVEKLQIAVCGLGTIGLFLVMFLKSLGYQQVYAAGNKDFQRQMAEKLGVAAEYFCDIRKCDPEKWIAEKTGGEGVDIFFECVGKNEVLTQGINSTAAGGTVLLVGNPAGDMALEKAAYWKILRHQLTVRGTWNSGFTHEETDDWHYVLQCLERGMIQPEDMITHRLKPEELIRGFELMRDKSEDYVKVMGVF